MRIPTANFGNEPVGATQRLTASGGPFFTINQNQPIEYQ